MKTSRNRRSTPHAISVVWAILFSIGLLVSLVLPMGAEAASGLGTWTVTGSMATARESHTATLLPNGKILVAGGFDNNFASLASAELYDPTTGTWSATGSMATARESHTATLLPNGKILVAGGYTGGGVASAELYNPRSGTWSATGSMTTARGLHTATLLSSGKVLVAGGRDNNLALLASAELYTPETAGLAVSPAKIFFREGIVLTGTRFGPNENVNVYVDTTTTRAVYTTATGADGSFVLDAIARAETYGAHVFIAVGQTSGQSAQASFAVIPRLSVSPASGSVGTAITVQGHGFGAGETVQVYWTTPRVLVGSATADNAWTFADGRAVTFPIPAGTPPGLKVVKAIGQVTKASATASVNVH